MSGSRVKQYLSFNAIDEKFTFNNIACCISIHLVEMIGMSLLSWPILSLVLPFLLAIPVFLRRTILVLRWLPCLLLLLLELSNLILLGCLLLPLLRSVALFIQPWTVTKQVVKRSTFETCSCNFAAFIGVMVSATMFTLSLNLSVLILSWLLLLLLS